MQINFGGREIALKLVYYGPALSGKTTNLRSLHQLTTEGARGRLMTLETKDDRTLFFDMLPLALRAETAPGAPSSGTGMTLRIKIFTVPGQILHASTQGWHLDSYCIDTVKEIEPEGSVGHLVSQIAVRHRYYTRLNRPRFVSADPHKRAILKHLQ